MEDTIRLVELCVFCKSTKTLRILNQNYLYNGSTLENYTNMLNECFKIQWPPCKDDKVCKKCVHRLREAVLFHRQVEKAYKCLIKQEDEVCIDMLDAADLNCDFSTPVAKTENEPIIPDHDQIDPLIKNFKYDQVVRNDDDNESINNDISQVFFVESDDDWSVSSEEMKRATGFYKILKQRPPPFIPVIKLSPPYKDCPVCLKTFESRFLLETHFHEHFPKFLCDKCGVGFTKNHQLLEHLRGNCDDGIQCSQCDNKYKLMNSLKQHIKKHHENKFLYKCEPCGQGFPNSMTRRLHMKEKHGVDILTYPCEQCGKLFYTHYLFKSHVDSVHLKIKNYHCKICASKFVSPSKLSQHMKRHEGITIPCEICGKGMASRKSLVDHLKIHYDIKKFKCDDCGKAFVQRTSLQWHLKSHCK